MPTVWVVNRSSHDYSPARDYGDLQYLSEGPMDKYSVNDIDRQFRAKLENSGKEDFILITSLTVMSSIACVIFALKHHCLNLLIYKSRGYIERHLAFEKEDK